jgi:hypothetical protein
MTGLKLLDPNPDQIALGDLSFEFNAVGTLSGHGFHPP